MKYLYESEQKIQKVSYEMQGSGDDGGIESYTIYGEDDEPIKEKYEKLTLEWSDKGISLSDTLKDMKGKTLHNRIHTDGVEVPFGDFEELHGTIRKSGYLCIDTVTAISGMGIPTDVQNVYIRYNPDRHDDGGCRRWAWTWGKSNDWVTKVMQYEIPSQQSWHGEHQGDHPINVLAEKSLVLAQPNFNNEGSQHTVDFIYTPMPSVADGALEVRVDGEYNEMTYSEHKETFKWDYQSSQQMHNLTKGIAKKKEVLNMLNKVDAAKIVEIMSSTMAKVR